MKTSHIKVALFSICFVDTIREIFCITNVNLNCQDPTNTDYCIEVGYDRDKPPPNPPLNVSMTLAISVRTMTNIFFSLKF